MADNQPRRATTVLALFALMSAQMLVVAGALSIPVLAQSIDGTLGATEGWIGIYGSVLFLIAALAAQTSSWFVGRFGGFRVSQFTLMLTGLGLAAIWIDQSIGLYVGAVLFGFAYSQSNTASGSLLSNLDLGAHRNLVFSIKQTAVPLGGILAASYLPFAAHTNGTEMALLGLACMCAIAWVLCECAGQFTDLHQPKSQTEPNTLKGDQPRLRVLILTFFVLAAVQLGMSVTFIGIIAPWLEITNDAATFVFGAAMFASILLRLGLGVLADHWGAAKVITAIKAAITLTLFTLLWLDGIAASLASLGCIAFAFAWNGVLLAEVVRADLSPERATSKAMTAFFLAGASSPLLIGWSANYEGGVGWVVAGLAFVCSLTLLTDARSKSFKGPLTHGTRKSQLHAAPVSPLKAKE